MNAINLYRISRWCYINNLKPIAILFQALIFLIYNSKIPPSVKIGRGSYFVCMGISTVLIPNSIIGSNCVIGLRFSTVRKFPYKNIPLIKNNVWIGPNVVIAGPVVIEDDVVIVANSFVNKSIPKGAIVAGSPARIIGWVKDLDFDLKENPKYKEGNSEYLTF